MIKQLESWYMSKDPPCLLLGPSGSGKSHMIQDFLRAHPECHEIRLAAPEKCITPMAYLEKRLIMKDVMCLVSTPVYTLDSLDTMLVSEKTLVADLVKFIKTHKELSEGKKKLILVASTAIERKVTELKKICTLIRLEAKETKEKEEARDTFVYTLSDALVGPRELMQYCSMDPWLMPLGAMEQLGEIILPSKTLGFLRGFMKWGKLISCEEEAFYHDELVQVATAYITLFFLSAYSSRGKRKDIKPLTSNFTHLLTLHSVRKRTWTEKYESGLPWYNDVHSRLGSKFSESTVDGLWKA